jgi:hypothetical protein
MKKFYPPAGQHSPLPTPTSATATLNYQIPQNRHVQSGPAFAILSVASFGLAVSLLTYWFQLAVSFGSLPFGLGTLLARLLYPINLLPVSVRLLSPPALLVVGLLCGIVGATKKRFRILSWTALIFNAVTLAALITAIAILFHALSGIH